MTITRLRTSICLLLSGLTVAGCGMVQVKTEGLSGTPAHAGTSAAAKPAQSAAKPAQSAAKASSPAEAKNGKYNTVLAHFPQMTAADVVDLDKVKSAIAQATPDMFYTSNDTKAPTYAEYFYEGDGSSPTPGTDPDALANEAGVGTASVPYAAAYGRTGNLYLAQRNVAPERLAPNTPILIWQVDTKGQGAVVVTLDGGVYWVRGSELSSGLKLPVLPGFPHGELPPPIQHNVLTAKQIKTLEAAGQLPSGTAKGIEDARTAGEACTSRLWKTRFAARDKANQTADIDPITRQNRAAQIRQQWWNAMNKDCAHDKAEFQSKLLHAIALRTAARKALYADAVAKAKQIASAH